MWTLSITTVDDVQQRWHASAEDRSVSEFHCFPADISCHHSEIEYGVLVGLALPCSFVSPSSSFRRRFLMTVLLGSLCTLHNSTLELNCRDFAPSPP